MTIAPRANRGGYFDPYSQGFYGVYTEKLLHKTWDLLRSSQLAGACRDCEEQGVHTVPVPERVVPKSVLSDQMIVEAVVRNTARRLRRRSPALSAIRSNTAGSLSSRRKLHHLHVAEYAQHPRGIPRGRSLPCQPVQRGIRRLMPHRQKALMLGRCLLHKVPADQGIKICFGQAGYIRSPNRVLIL